MPQGRPQFLCPNPPYTLLILFHFLNINIEALLFSKGRVAQTSRHGCPAHPGPIAGWLLDTPWHM